MCANLYRITVPLKFLSVRMWKDLVVTKELFYKFTIMGFLDLILDK